MQASTPTPKRLSTALWALSAATGALILALAEAVYILLSTGAPSGWERLHLVSALVGFYLPTGLLFGVALGLLWGAASASVGAPLGSKLRESLITLRDDPERDGSAAAWVLATALSLVIAALVPGGVFFIVREFENTTNSAVFLSLTSLVGMVLAATLAPPFRLLWGFLLRVIPGGGTLFPKRLAVALFFVVVLPFFGAILFLLRQMSAGVDTWPVWFALFQLILTFAFLGLLRKAGRRPSWVAVGFLSVGAVLLLSTTAITLGERQELPSLLSKDSLAAKRFLQMARVLSDRDKDGQSELFAGGDCDDSDKDVHPGAKEIAGNGKDDNCLGGDAKLSNKEPTTTNTSQASADPKDPALPELNFLIITVDTLRADRLGAYGYDRPTSPRMDELAKDAVMFQNTYAQAPHTPRSFPSFLTSKLPHEVAWVKSFANYPEMKDENVTFFEVLSEAGYQTSAVMSHHYFKPERKLNQGIQDFSNENPGTIAESNTAVKGPEIIGRAKEKLKALGDSKKKFALWVHVYEPHASYIEHEDGPQFGKSLSDKYDGEIAFIDRYIGELLDSLKQQKLDKNTVVILFSDHGESFKDHGVYFHGSTLYDEILRVPLLIRVPGFTPHIVKERVALLDLFPTICALAKAPTPDGLRGLSLMPSLRGRPLEGSDERVIAAELLPYPNLDEEHLVLLKGRYKLLHRVKPDNLFELFDLETDPKEQTNIYQTDAKAKDTMLQVLEGFDAGQ